MKISIQQQPLQEALTTVGKVIENKPLNPVLSNFLCKVKDGEMTITASDTLTMVTTSVFGTTTEGEMDFMVDAYDLTENVKSLPNEKLTLQANECSTLDCHWTKGELTMPISLEVTDFPEYDKFEHENTPRTLKISAPFLHRSLRNLKYAIGSDENRPALNGILFEVTNGRLSLVATDAHVMTCFHKNEVESEGDFSFTVPKKTILLLTDITAKMKEDCEIDYYVRYAKFHIGNVTITARLIDAKFPSYKSVIPKHNTLEAKIGKAVFLNTARRIATCGRSASKSIKICLTKDCMSMESKNFDGSYAKETLDCTYCQEDIQVNFNSKHLIEAVENFPSNGLVLTLKDKSTTMLMQPLDNDDPDNQVETVIVPTMPEE